MLLTECLDVNDSDEYIAAYKYIIKGRMSNAIETYQIAVFLERFPSEFLLL